MIKTTILNLIDYNNQVDILYEKIKNKESINNELIKKTKNLLTKLKKDLLIIKKEKFKSLNQKINKKEIKKNNFNLNQNKLKKKINFFLFLNEMTKIQIKIIFNLKLILNLIFSYRYHNRLRSLPG